MTGKRTVQEILDSLGRSIEEVAANVRARGIRGVPYSGDRCVLARYIQAEGHHVRVGHRAVKIGPDVVGRFGNTLVQEFRRAFDSGEFPDMIEEES